MPGASWASRRWRSHCERAREVTDEQSSPANAVDERQRGEPRERVGEVTDEQSSPANAVDERQRGEQVSPKPTPAGGAPVDALLEPTFLENATTEPMAEVRRLRREAEQQEVNLSYTRRLL